MVDAVENIVNKILEDAKSEAEVYYEEAQRRINEIREEEYKLWDKEKQRLEAEFQREAEDIRIQIISRAHMEGKRIIVSEREKVINKVLEKILAEFRNSGHYGDYLKRCVEDAHGLLGDEFVIKCIPEDKVLVNTLVSKISPLAKVDTEMIRNGGIIAESVDGLRRVDYSVAALVERRMQDIRKLILDKLFEGEYA